jgi:hypothetical protein
MKMSETKCTTGCTATSQPSKNFSPRGLQQEAKRDGEWVDKKCASEQDWLEKNCASETRYFSSRRCTPNCASLEIGKSLTAKIKNTLKIENLKL